MQRTLATANVITIKKWHLKHHGEVYLHFPSDRTEVRQCDELCVHKDEREN